MDALLQLLVEHGYLILLAWVFLDQVAIPVPAMPMILAAGALAGEGHLALGLCALIVVLACLPANLFWFWFGRRKGNSVLTLLCIISIEPDTCVNSTLSVFQRYGTASILLSKFVPGLQTIAPPVAGMLGVGAWRFVLLDGLGSVLYALAFLLPGYLAHDFIAEIAVVMSDYATTSGVMLALGATAWFAWKMVRRVLFLRSLRGRRVDPLELLERLGSDAAPQPVDIRQRLEFNDYPYTLPGAVRMPMDVFDERVAQLSRERPLVLFCT